MTRALFAAILFTQFLLFPGSAAAQPRVSRENLFERVVAIVPYIGRGTMDDPRRPLYSPDDLRDAGKSGLVSVQCQESDDGKSAICEFTARDRRTLDPILKANRGDVKAFVRGIHPKAAIDAEMKKVKKDFDADGFVNPGHARKAAEPAKPVQGGAR